MYSNNIVKFEESTTILNACTKNSGKLLKAPYIYIYKQKEREREKKRERERRIKDAYKYICACALFYAR